MKQLLITIAALVLVGCGESQESATAPEAKPAEPVAEAAKPEPPAAKEPDISIHDAAKAGDINAVKQHLADGVEVNAKNSFGETVLHHSKTKEIAELLIANGADVNAKSDARSTPLHSALYEGRKEIAELLIAKGANVNAKGGLGSTPMSVAAYIMVTRKSSNCLLMLVRM